VAKKGKQPSEEMKGRDKKKCELKGKLKGQALQKEELKGRLLE